MNPPPWNEFRNQFYQDAEPEKTEKLTLAIQSVASMSNSYPPAVIQGLLRQTEILLMGGQAKRWKSWARLDMLYCVANGLPWLCFPTCQGMVIHLDLELLEADLRNRFELIHQSYIDEGRAGSFDNLRIVALRGRSFTPSELDRLPEAFESTHFVLISLDPVYRLLAGKGESDPSVVSDLLSRFLQLGFNLNAAVALLQHFAKGDPGVKESQDRFSGSGVWARYPDALMTFTDLEEENCFCCEFNLRSFQPIEPFAIRWEFPRFRIDQKVDHEKLKAPRGRPKVTSIEEFCALLTPSDSLAYTDFWHRADKILHISKKTFDRRLKDAKNQRLIYLSPATNEYGLTPNYLQTNGQLG